MEQTKILGRARKHNGIVMTVWQIGEELHGQFRRVTRQTENVQHNDFDFVID